jgi:chloramphenicol O-acetyltransferase
MDSTPPSKDTVLQTGLKRKIQQSIYKRPILLTEINMGLQRKASKNAIVFLISYVFSSTKSENKRMELVLPRSGTRVVGSKMAQTMYTHVSKYKNIKIKNKNNKNTNQHENDSGGIQFSLEAENRQY